MIARDSSPSDLVYIDANVFLNYILYDPQSIPLALVAGQFLEQVRDRQVNACTSLLTWDELTWVVRRELTLEDARKQGLEFLDFPWLQFLNVTKDVVKKAQEIVCLLNSLVICQFSYQIYNVRTAQYLNWLNSITGLELSTDKFLMAGERIFNLKRLAVKGFFLYFVDP